MGIFYIFPAATVWISELLNARSKENSHQVVPLVTSYGIDLLQTCTVIWHGWKLMYSTDLIF